MKPVRTPFRFRKILSYPGSSMALCQEMNQMKASNDRRWEINITGLPMIKKKCPKCNSIHYSCSEKFRMNAQKKNIDIWLIYKCVSCNTTLNVTILSRTKPELVPKGLFEQFTINDPATAWRYALDPEIIRKNSLELDYSTMEYEIRCEPVTLDSIACGDDEVVSFIMETKTDIPVKLSVIIRKHFGISLSQLDKMTEAGIFTISTSVNLKKCKIKDGLIFRVHRDKLKEFMEK